MAAPAARPEHATVHRSCPLCEAKCGISVEVERARGEVLGVRGDPEDPFSRGYICPKAHGLVGLQHDPDRLRRPIRRSGSRWSEIGWEEAFEEVAGDLLADLGYEVGEEIPLAEDGSRSALLVPGSYEPPRPPGPNRLVRRCLRRASRASLPPRPRGRPRR